MDSSIVWIFFATICTLLVYLYKRLTQNFGYWESQGIPAVKAYPIIGSELSSLWKNMHELDLERLKTYGRIYGAYFLTARILTVTDPEILKLILVKDFPVFVNRDTLKTGVKAFDLGIDLLTNDDWKRIRAVVSTSFSSGKIKMMSHTMKTISNRFTKHLDDLSEKGGPVNMRNEFANFSVEVIASCAFGISLNAFKNPSHPFLINSKKLFQGGIRPTVYLLIMSLLPNFMDSVRSMLVRSLGVNYFTQLTDELIRERTAKPSKDKVDLLQLMLNAMEENDISEEKKSQWTKTLDLDEVKAQTAAFLAAGHEAVGAALTFVVLNLARYPDVQEKLHREIDEVWEKHGGVDYDVVKTMTYLDAVISETLRLYPVTVRVLRRAKESYLIPNTNIVIPEDAVISIPIYALHLDPEYFPEPEKFDPNRFLPENKDNILPYTYLPFAEGPRNCVAMRFALVEMKLCLTTILRYIKFLPTAETMKPQKLSVALQVLRSDSVIVIPERRRNCDLI